MSRYRLYEAPDSENEALWIADTLEKLLSKHPRDRAAILYRTNFQSRQIEEALRRYGRKYIVVGGFSFYQRAEIKDLLAYLKVAANPNDSISLLRHHQRSGSRNRQDDRRADRAVRACNDLSIWNGIGRMLDERAFGTRADSSLAVLPKAD